jgi:hypothetical protein
VTSKKEQMLERAIDHMVAERERMTALLARARAHMAPEAFVLRKVGEPPLLEPEKLVDEIDAILETKQ